MLFAAKQQKFQFNEVVEFVETDFFFSDFVDLVNGQSLNGLNVIWISELLGGGFKYFLTSPLPGDDSHFD